MLTARYNSGMARPLWKDLRAAREQRSLAALPTLSKVPLPPRPRWKIALLSAAIAIAAIVLEHVKHGDLSSSAHLNARLWALGTSAAFLIFGSIAVRRFATQLARLVHIGAGPTAANAIRLIFTIAGLLVVVLVTIALLGVDATKLLAAAGITGVIFGLAAQQSLGNVFAGIVLMVARPFSIGQRIRIRSGSFGGIFDAEVRAMGLTYVELMTDDGLLKVPNLGILAAAVGPAPEPPRNQETKALYVDRALPKRPPRAAATRPAPPSPRRSDRQARAAHREVVKRRPREIIRRTRGRRAAGGDGSAAEPNEPGPEAG